MVQQKDALPLTFAQRKYASYAHGVAKCPACVCLVSMLTCLFLSVGWSEEVRLAFGIKPGKGEGGIESPMDFEKLWSSSKGPLHGHFDQWKSRNTTFEGKTYVTMFVGKGRLEGKDIMTAEVVQMTAALMRDFHSINVTTSGGNWYTTSDLCTRLFTPDKPFPGHGKQAPGAVYRLPCTIVSPLNCFEEYLDIAAHETLKVIDPLLEVPWTGKPRYSDPAVNIKAAVFEKQAGSGRRGCDFLVPTSTFTPAIWGGGLTPKSAIVESENSDFTEIKAFKWYLLMDSPSKLSFRMQYRDGVDKRSPAADEVQIQEALDEHNKRWQDMVDTFSRENPLLDVTNFLDPDTMKEVQEEQKGVPAGQIILGYVFMAGFIFASLFGFQRPGQVVWIVGLLGLLTVFLCMITALSLYLLMGWYVNSITMGVLPFLALGLGVNDMFVLIRVFSQIYQEPWAAAAHTTNADIIVELLQRAGPGILLTSSSNAMTFICGGLLLPVPAMADFCVAAALTSVCNFAGMLSQVLPMLAITLRTFRPREEIASRCAGKVSPGKKVADRFEALPTRKVVACQMVLWPVAVALLVLSGISINNQEFGYVVSETIPDGTNAQKSMDVYFGDFQDFVAYLVFYDLDVSANQRQMIELYNESCHNVRLAEAYINKPYLTIFYDYVYSKNASLLNNSWTHPLYAPHGIMEPSSFDHWFDEWRRIPWEDATVAWGPAGNVAQPDFASADLAKANTFGYYEGQPHKPIRLSFFEINIVDIQDNNRDIIESVKLIDGAIANSPIRDNAFAYGPTFVYWSIFVGLAPVIFEAVGMSLVLVFACTFVCLAIFSQPLNVAIQGCISGQSGFGRVCREMGMLFGVSCTTALMCAMIVAQIWGLGMTFLKFNMVVAATLLAATGMSIEFVAHFVAVFVMEPGTPQQRLTKTFGATCPAVFCGSLSTFVSLIPLVWSEYVFIVKYCFGLMAMVQAIGLFNGFGFLPAFLGPMAMLPCMRAPEADPKTELDEKKALPTMC